VSPDGKLVLIANGEIYNHDVYRTRLAQDYDFQTCSDCEVILPLYLRYGEDCVKHLDGQFAFVLYDGRDGSVFAARDHMGIVPLYWSQTADGVWFSSEMKALPSGSIQVFPPGHYYCQSQISRWWEPSWFTQMPGYTGQGPSRMVLEHLAVKLRASVGKRLMADVPWGVLLSGGLDSSLVAALANRPGMKSFSIGLEGSPDLAAAAVVAKHLGSDHHAFTYTVEEGIAALEAVIRSIETYDVTTIRASTPMFLMAREIRKLGVKMVLSGEGADEIFGGYLYFHKAPSREEFHCETVRKLQTLHLYDCLRANKSMMAWGVEARVPFLDRAFLDLAMGLDPAYKMSSTSPHGARMEKHLLRSAFEGQGLIPDEVLWRQKEQFSDGVGYSWIDSLKEVADQQVSDEDFQQAASRWPVNTPATKEAYFYRSIFQKEFPSEDAAKTVPGGPSVACSTPTALAWDKSFREAADPSGRAVGVHRDAY